MSTFIKYKRDAVANIAIDIVSLKTAASTEITAREITGPPEELLENLTKNGVQGIYPDRATAFRTFSRIWEREHQIRIVESSIEGFKRGIGIDARELLMPKLEKDPNSSIYILLTHSSFAHYRESQEHEIDGYISAQIKATSDMLQELSKFAKAGDRFKWKFFKGAPTCFMIMAGNFMLLNPYLYMQPAYFNFTMIVRNTNSLFDIFNHYKQYHFQRAWDNLQLSTDDAGFGS